MKREDLLKEMKDGVGTKDPVIFFDKMVDVFTLLFDRIDVLKNELSKVKLQSALAIQWEPKVAADMLDKQVEILRQDKDTYFQEITELKQAYIENKVTQNYHDFVKFWKDTLGFHPFLE
jgi:hypothetical protein